jgi:uncharacterized protein YgbK (DUF1537 family)
MQRHPVTPMSEADLRVHLSRQTSRPIELIDVHALDAGIESIRDRLGLVQMSGAVVLFDTLTDDHLETIGRVICDVQQGDQMPLFVAGSSGIVYALVKYWQASGIAPGADQSSSHGGTTPISPVDRTVVLSGSCSPVTDRQIGWALENGFSEVAIDPFRIRQSKRLEADICAIAMQILSALDSGRSVVAHTCRGPADSRIKIVKPTIGPPADGGRTLGAILSRILREVLRVRPVRRVAVVGGDTAGEVARTLDVEAVEMIGPLEPGAPLCVIRSRDSSVDGLEITFKGGQVGYDDFFGTLLSGRCKRSFIGVTS